MTEAAAAETPTSLYRHFNKKGDLLYVGISLSFISRLAQHKQSSKWFSEIVRVEVEHFTTREAALEGERLAIAEEKPKHNKQRPSTTPLKIMPVPNKEISREDLMRRVVQFNPIYDLYEVGQAFGVGPGTVKKWIEEQKLGYIVIGHTYKGNEIRRVTGWQLIDFIEFKEREVMRRHEPDPH